EEQTRLFGTDHLYASDTFIEMSPPSNDPAFPAGMGRAVYSAMAAADPQATWVMQGWIFFNNPAVLAAAAGQGALQCQPDERLILIEMGWDKFLVTEAYYGKPWMWTVIQNFWQHRRPARPARADPRQGGHGPRAPAAASSAGWA
ncbi:MAG: hypothetical protein M5U09_05305, partial [Gammaproteobacteria bacterium]|nr:hypothetical protein [Gammaproteobacteria bacterium]